MAHKLPFFHHFSLRCEVDVFNIPLMASFLWCFWVCRGLLLLLFVFGFCWFVLLGVRLVVGCFCLNHQWTYARHHSDFFVIVHTGSFYLGASFSCMNYNDLAEAIEALKQEEKTRAHWIAKPCKCSSDWSCRLPTKPQKTKMKLPRKGFIGNVTLSILK